MDKIKQISVSFFVVFISTIYVLYQPEKSNPAVAVVATEVQQKAASSTLVTSKTIRVVSPDLKVEKTSKVPKKTNIKNTPLTTPSPSKPTPPQVPPKKKSPVPVSKPTPTPATIPKGRYKDGTYTGSSVNAYYGYVQVQPTIQAGKIVAVTFLKTPNNRQTSLYINAQARPLLEKEAIQAQSARVSGVSGATYTSKAFRKALDSALVQAQNK